MLTALIVILATSGALLLGAGILHVFAHFAPGAHDCLCRAPLLDFVVAYFTAAPWFLGPAIALHAGVLDHRLPVLVWWWGLVAAVAGQVLSLLIWTRAHELMHRQAARGPRIVKSLNHSVGRARNHAAVWWTALAVPVFWVVRLAELIVYPPLVWLVRFPRYRQSEWVNVSRHKFSGLVGHDLVWCLYCDWMTGVWALGAEMLRNVESFWCPIRFLDATKCANCSLDFPDNDSGWVRPEAGMEGVARVIEEQYPPQARVNSWFGHPERATTTKITIEGQSVER